MRQGPQQLCNILPLGQSSGSRKQAARSHAKRTEIWKQKREQVFQNKSMTLSAHPTKAELQLRAAAWHRAKLMQPAMIRAEIWNICRKNWRSTGEELPVKFIRASKAFWFLHAFVPYTIITPPSLLRNSTHPLYLHNNLARPGAKNLAVGQCSNRCTTLPLMFICTDKDHTHFSKIRITYNTKQRTPPWAPWRNWGI